jgi:hypothetical protein
MNLLRTSLSIVIAGAALFAANAYAGPAVLSEGFDSQDKTCIRRGLEPKATAVIGGEYGRDGKGVRVEYKGMDQGSTRTVFSCPIEPANEYTLTYDVRFDKDFQFVKGGKLHGLGPERVMSGGDGTAPDGWSARVVFRGDGGVETYVYNQGQKGDYGQIDRAKDFRFEPGKFYRVKLYVKVNSAGDASDGIVRLWIDDKLLIERNDIRYRAVGGNKALISRVLFSTFHGGSRPDWAPKDRNGNYASVFADFDNFVVSKGAP